MSIPAVAWGSGQVEVILDSLAQRRYWKPQEGLNVPRSIYGGDELASSTLGNTTF